MTDEATLRRDICEAGRRLWERGLVGATEGNLSARLGQDRLLCTPSGLSKGHMTPDDLVVCDHDGRPEPGQSHRPSSEIRLHLAAFRARPDCQAVVHAHPPIATAFTLAEVEIPDDLLPEAAYVLGPVASVPFAFPGTDEVPDTLAPYLAGHKTFLLSHHGAAVLGSSVEDAYNRMETLERIARIVLYARLLGRAVPMPDAALSRLRQVALTGALA
jgi:L-fuculose-phosphate aldolase